VLGYMFNAVADHIPDVIVVKMMAFLRQDNRIDLIICREVHMALNTDFRVR
jgi:hypothetical protein